MKKILLMLFLAGTVSAGFAQDSVKTKLKNRQAEDLKLSEKQTTELREINKSYMQRMQDLRKNEGLAKADKQKQLETLNTERTGKIKAVLSAEQFDKWQSNREKTMARAESYKHKKDGRHGKGMPLNDDAVKALGLTDAQSAELKTINKDFMAKAGELRKKSELTKEQRHEQMKSLNTARLDKIKATLGNEKYQQYDAWAKQEKEKYKSMKKKDGMKKKKGATENL